MPGNVINDFARTLGVDVAGSMDVDDDYAGGKTNGFDGIKKKVKELMREGYSASQILSQVMSFLYRLSGALLTCCRSSTILSYYIQH